MQDITIPARVIFSKTGRAKYISHLDTMRTMTRALRRSGLPVWYTQGFNPHLYLTFPLPLALGVESLCEPVDFRLTSEIPFEQVSARLGECLPPGFEVKSATAPLMPAGGIAWAQYDIELDFPPGEREAMREALLSLFAEPAIEVLKKGKKGERLLDIRPHAALLETRITEDGLGFTVRLAAGNTLNISPGLLLEAFSRAAHASGSPRILRTRICDGNLTDFA